MVHEVDGPKELGLDKKKFTKISIFMNIFDCHVNRTLVINPKDPYPWAIVSD